MNSFPWLQSPLAHLGQQLLSGHLAHAQILGLDIGLGGKTLAQAMAQLVLCREPSSQGACGDCKSCQLTQASSHPDLHELTADGLQIKVDQVRQLTQALTQTPQQGGYRVAIIYEAQRMNIAASNALLKTLEEPGMKTLLILQTSQAQSLLATIRSRCVQLPIVKPTGDTLQQWLSQQLGAEFNGLWALPLAGGPLTLVEAYHDKRYQQWQTWRQDWQQSLRSGHLQGSLLQLKEDELPLALMVLYGLLQLKLKHTQGWDAFKRQTLSQLTMDVALQLRRLETAMSIQALGLCQSFLLRYRQLAT